MNAKTAKLLRRYSHLLGYNEALADLKRAWHLIPRPRRHQARAEMQSAIKKWENRPIEVQEPEL